MGFSVFSVKKISDIFLLDAQFVPTFMVAPVFFLHQPKRQFLTSDYQRHLHKIFSLTL